VNALQRGRVWFRCVRTKIANKVKPLVQQRGNSERNFRRNEPVLMKHNSVICSYYMCLFPPNCQDKENKEFYYPFIIPFQFGSIILKYKKLNFKFVN